MIHWRRRDRPGTDVAEIISTMDGWLLTGVATFAESGRSWRVEYAIDCDEAWRTRRCTVRGSADEIRAALDVSRDERGRWTVDGRAHALLDGCEDADLGFTPATNALPIRRLRLAIGAKAHVRAAWVRFPELRVEVLEQDYTRLGPDQYLYESAGGSFRRELTVNEHGLVLDYPGLWVAEPRG
ncbi:MAG: putative glycolipid-binding domain-containing protein [Gemmatimonadaceae bacterium]